MHHEVLSKAKQARAAAATMAAASAALKNRALCMIAGALEAESGEIIAANAVDLENLQQKGGGKAFQDRLLLTGERIGSMAEGLRQIAQLEDPVGEVERMWTRPNGLQIGLVRVPVGVIGIIYEARPNVTADAAGLALKSGNAVILRGGSESLHSNKILVRLIREQLAAAGLPGDAVSLVEDTDRAAARALMRLNGLVDLLIPRGGPSLIKTVIENSTVPVIQTGAGNCHVYVDRDADPAMAVAIAVNAKVQRPGVCNAMETLLVHREAAGVFLPAVIPPLLEAGVELRGCARTAACHPSVRQAVEEDWAAEYLDLVLAVKVVDGFDEAVEHINRYGTMHSEAIITADYARAREFLRRVDAAVVYVNASTRFTDGFAFGLGAEMGISTQKLHARGPMGLQALTTRKYIVYGDGQIR